MSQVLPLADRVYEDFEPPSDWSHDQESDTLILMLPEFKKQQLRVQIAANRILRLSGERQIHENKWVRFRKEVTITPESDTSRISANFEVGMLYVRIPKLITPSKPQPATTTPTQQEAPKPPHEPTAEAPNAQAAHADQQKPTIMDKAAEGKTEKTTEAPAPTLIAPLQHQPKANEDSQKKPRVVDKAAEAKAEKTSTEAPAPTPIEPLKEPKADEDSQKKPVQKEKGKAETDANKVAKERGGATTSKAQEMHEITRPDGLAKGEAKMDERSPTLELLSRQTQDYKNALSGSVEVLKKQKKLANLVVVIFLVLVFGLYVKNAIKSSSFGGPKRQEL